MDIFSELLPWSLEILGFFLKIAIVVIGILIIIGFSIKSKDENKIQILDLNERFRDYKNTLLQELLTKKDLKKELKKQAEDDKSLKSKPRSFFIQFEGDIKATNVTQLKEVITAILTVARKDDEVIIGLESPGGVVHGYGLAASQIQRIKDAQIPLTICVDKVAASGGYMMACLADKIIAAPFAIIGSVGVVASLPNFNKLLKKNDVDYYQITSGQYKRTVSLLGEIQPEGLSKFKEEIEQTHDLFKNHVKKFRPQIDLQQIATGEHWFGTTALQMKLIDSLGTSDDYLYQQSQSRQIKEVRCSSKKSLKDKIAESMTHLIHEAFDTVLERFSRKNQL